MHSSHYFVIILHTSTLPLSFFRGTPHTFNRGGFPGFMLAHMGTQLCPAEKWSQVTCPNDLGKEGGERDGGVSGMVSPPSATISSSGTISAPKGKE